MKIFFFFVVVVHGLIHLLGFMKAFRLAPIDSSFTTEISKPMGLAWLLSTSLFLLVAILAVLEKQWVWFPALLAIFLSQTLIFLTWAEAKFGTMTNLLV